MTITLKQAKRTRLTDLSKFLLLIPFLVKNGHKGPCRCSKLINSMKSEEYWVEFKLLETKAIWIRVPGRRRALRQKRRRLRGGSWRTNALPKWRRTERGSVTSFKRPGVSCYRPAQVGRALNAG